MGGESGLLEEVEGWVEGVGIVELAVSSTNRINMQIKN